MEDFEFLIDGENTLEDMGIEADNFLTCEALSFGF